MYPLNTSNRHVIMLDPATKEFEDGEHVLRPIIAVRLRRQPHAVGKLGGIAPSFGWVNTKMLDETGDR